MDMVASAIVHKSGMIRVVLLPVLTHEKRRRMPILMTVPSEPVEECRASVQRVRDLVSETHSLHGTESL